MIELYVGIGNYDPITHMPRIAPAGLTRVCTRVFWANVSGPALPRSGPLVPVPVWTVIVASTHRRQAASLDRPST